jgi:4-amino-4-deoxy-L-arabinose transferase-like glycosyltransferase
VLLALRLLDVLIVAPMVALTWLIGREVWPRSRRRPLVAAAVVALFAPLAYTAANVNNDALILLLIAAATALSARLLRRGADVRLAAALGLVVSIGLLTKIEMVLAAPALGLCVLAAAGTRGTRLRSAVAFAILAAPGAAWWLDELGGGGPLTPDSSELLGAPVPGPWAHPAYLTYAAKKLPTLAGRVFVTFDAPVTFLQDPVRHALVLAVAVMAVAWFLLRRWRRPRAAEIRIGVLAGVPLALALGTLYASVDGYRYTGQLRGLSPRYVYPGIPVLAIGAVAAIATIADRLRLRAWRPLALTGVTLLAAGAAATIARAVQGNYSSSSWPDILDRARAVSPVGRPAEVAVALGLAWVAVLTLAAGRLAGVARGAPNEPEPEPS